VNPGAGEVGLQVGVGVGDVAGQRGISLAARRNRRQDQHLMAPESSCSNSPAWPLCACWSAAVGAGAKVLQISRFESAHGSSRRATRARSDVGQGLTSLSPLVAGIAARMALAVEEILAELDQEPRGGRQVIL